MEKSMEAREGARDEAREEVSEEARKEVREETPATKAAQGQMEELAVEMDRLDAEMVGLLKKRVELDRKLSACRLAAGLPEEAPGGERAKVAQVRRLAGDELAAGAGVLCSSVLDVCRAGRRAAGGEESPLVREINAAVAGTPALFPESAMVACQGVEGAYSQQAAEKLFAHPDIMYFSSFEGVFSAVDKGLCSYGVLPLENSTAGSVNAIYDLMMKYKFHIVRSARLKVDHSLLALPGTKLENIRRVCSHPQALSQSAAFIKSLGGVEVTECANTAQAAQMVAQSGRNDMAALSSRSCAGLYGLETLADSVQDQGGNFTRFICISKNLEIYPGADRTSVMLTIAHRPGSLCRIMSRISALDINLSKLESRPIPERDFEFMFYFDLDAPVYSPRFARLMGQLEDMCESFQYLGSYREMA